jgi:hypothetical protein
MSTPPDRPSLRDTLTEISGEARPVDLSDRVARTSRHLRRQRAAAVGLVVAAVAGAGGFAWSNAPSADRGSGQVTGGITTVPVPGVTATGTASGPVVFRTAGPSDASASLVGVITPTPPNTTATATTTPTGGTATARPAAAAPKHVPAGHGCANPYTDELGGSSPFASSAQRQQASTMGTALCGHVGATKVSVLTEWISMGGLGKVGKGVTYDVQVTGGSGYTSAHHGIYLAIFRPKVLTGTGKTPTVTLQGGALRAQWPDGTVVLMTAGEDGPLTRQIIVDPAFDAFR